MIWWTIEKTKQRILYINEVREIMNKIFRCANCFDCPHCSHTMNTRASSVAVPSQVANTTTKFWGGEASSVDVVEGVGYFHFINLIHHLDFPAFFQNLWRENKKFWKMILGTENMNCFNACKPNPSVWGFYVKLNLRSILSTFVKAVLIWFQYGVVL